VRLRDDLRKKKISLDRKFQADSKTGVNVEKQAKNDQVMGPQTLLTKKCQRIERCLFSKDEKWQRFIYECIM